MTDDANKPDSLNNMKLSPEALSRFANMTDEEWRIGMKAAYQRLMGGTSILKNLDLMHGEFERIYDEVTSDD